MSSIVKISTTIRFRSSHILAPSPIFAVLRDCLSFKSALTTPNIFFITNGCRCISSLHKPFFATIPNDTLADTRGSPPHHRRIMSLWTGSRPCYEHLLNKALFGWNRSYFDLTTRVRCLNNHSHNYDTRKQSDVRDEDMSKQMYQNIVFMDDNLVAVNKPYGLSVFGSSTESSEKSGDSKNKNNIKTLSNILPSLNNKLNCPALSVGLSLKSFYSGIVLLCKHKESAKKLTSFIAECQTQKIQYITYLAITVGMPQCSYEVDLTTNIKRERLHNREMTTVTDIYCHSACKEGKMIKILFNVKPLVVNRSAGAALVQVTINKDKWGAVEVLMSHYLSPVLGDHIYSSRTYMVAEVPFAASAHAAPPAKQKLPSSITELLNSNTDSNDQAEPLFVHRHKLVLNKFPKRSSPPVIITAPPQKEFLTTLQCLGLYKEDMFS